MMKVKYLGDLPLNSVPSGFFMNLVVDRASVGRRKLEIGRGRGQETSKER